MAVEFFHPGIERYFFKDRSEEKKYRAFKILDNGLLITLPVRKSPGSLNFHISIGF
jgi:hypothetical protein